MKLKHYEIESRVEFFHEPIGDTLRRYKTIKKYAYILHDKDSDTSPHYHIYVNFGNSGVDSKLVAEWFGLQESQINRIQGRATDMLQYLTHSNPSQRHKYQYSPSEVIANFDFEAEIEKSKIIGDFKKYTYAQQLQYVNTLPVSEKKTAYNTLCTLWKLHCQVLSLEPDRNISVMFIYGKPGSGKTTNAKMLAESMGYDVCISSASNDPWQDYYGQKCMILDDVRDSTFSTFEDLLKLIDNNTSSSAAARYGNRVFNGELIILTSSVPLSFWYRNLILNKSESLKQLYRRITYYVEVTEHYVKVFDKLDDAGRPTGMFQVYKNKVQSLKGKKENKKIDYGAAFGKFSEPLPFDEIE